jgi:Xaa-Pro aminopeptidase
VVEDGETEFGSFLAFEVLTMCPFERKLIDTSLLSDAEIHMVNTYHTWVRDELDPYLDEAERTWLAQATAAL